MPPIQPRAGAVLQLTAAGVDKTNGEDTALSAIRIQTSCHESTRLVYIMPKLMMLTNTDERHVQTRKL